MPDRIPCELNNENTSKTNYVDSIIWCFRDVLLLLFPGLTESLLLLIIMIGPVESICLVYTKKHITIM